MSQYAYGTDEEHIVIRLRAGRGDLTECILHYGDRACRLTPVLFTEQKMAVVAQTEEFDYWETTLEHPYKRLCYYFTLSDPTSRLGGFQVFLLPRCGTDPHHGSSLFSLLMSVHLLPFAVERADRHRQVQPGRDVEDRKAR